MKQASLIKFAWREVHATLKSFMVMIFCLALGVASIITIHTMINVMNDALAREGRVILGGDIAISIVGREASPQELAVISSKGTVSKMITLRTMARLNENAISLVELKAVDNLYPLYGAISPANPLKLGEALVEDALLVKLNAQKGVTVSIGEISVLARDVIESEPDKLAQGFGLGPRVMVSLETLEASKLIQFGSLMRVHYRIKTQGDNAAIFKDLQESFKNSGFDLRSFANASPQLANQIKRFGEILGLSSFITLFIGALGISYAISRFIEKKQITIATLKALGASHNTILMLFGLQITALAIIGIALGVLVGVILPYGLNEAVKSLLPLPLGQVFSPKAIALGAAYGLLISALAAILPLSRVKFVKVAALYRDERKSVRYSAATITSFFALLVAVIALALFTAHQKLAMLAFFAGMAVVYGLLWLFIYGFNKFAAQIKHPLLQQFSRSKGFYGKLMLTLSMGLTLITVLFLVDGTLAKQLDNVNQNATPAFFFVDIPRQEEENFEKLVLGEFPKGSLKRVANLRGRIIALNGIAAEKAVVAPTVKWIFQGDRGVTYADALPEGSKLVDGTFWAKNYNGTPLVSMEDKLAKDLNLKIGDKITVSVLGRQIEAELANTRQVNWQSFGINFFMVFSHNTFKGAPHTWLATLNLPNSSKEKELQLLSKVMKAYPSLTSVRVKEAIEAINALSQRISFAMKAVSLISLLAAMLVLSSIMAAQENARLKEVTLYKVLGATSGAILKKSLITYATLGIISAFIAISAGFVVTGVVTLYMFQTAPIMDFGGTVTLLTLALIITLTLGLYGTYKALKTKPTYVLRHL